MDFTKDIASLMRIQDIDALLHDKEKHIHDLPLFLEQLQTEATALLHKKNIIEEKITILKQQEKKVLQKIATDVSNIQRSKDKLMLISSKKEYNAVAKEIDTLEKSNRIHDEEKLLLYEELSIQENNLTDIDLLYYAKEEERKALAESIEASISAFTKEIIQLQSKRTTFAKDVSVPMLTRYDFIRNRIAHPVLAEVSGGVCKSCRMVLPSQVLSNLMNAQQIYTCPSCQRILYLAGSAQ